MIPFLIPESQEWREAEGYNLRRRIRDCLEKIGNTEERREAQGEEGSMIFIEEMRIRDWVQVRHTSAGIIHFIFVSVFKAVKMSLVSKM